LLAFDSTESCFDIDLLVLKDCVGVSDDLIEDVAGVRGVGVTGGTSFFPTLFLGTTSFEVV